MGSRGPSATPTAILKQRGSWRGVARDKVEPKPPAGVPDPPAVMPDEVRVIYDGYLALLETVPGLLTQVDGGALARMAVLEWHFWDSVARSKKYGKTFPVKGKLLETVRFGTHQHWSDVKDLAALLDKLGSKFGLTPADRSRMEISAPEPVAEGKARFFGAVG